MSLFSTHKITKDEPKVQNSEYIRTQNAPDAPTPTPGEPAKPADAKTE